MATVDEIANIARDEIKEKKLDEGIRPALEATTHIVADQIGPICESMILARKMNTEFGREFSAGIFATMMIMSCGDTDEAFLTLEETKKIIVKQENKVNKSG